MTTRDQFGRLVHAECSWVYYATYTYGPTGKSKEIHQDTIRFECVKNEIPETVREIAVQEINQKHNRSNRQMLRELIKVKLFRREIVHTLLCDDVLKEAGLPPS